MAYIGRSRPILANHAVRIRRERTQAIRIAAGAIVRVASGERDLSVNSRIHVHNELILVVEASGVHQNEEAGSSEWEDTTTRKGREIRAGQWGVDILRSKHVQPVGIRVGNRHG